MPAKVKTRVRENYRGCRRSFSVQSVICCGLLLGAFPDALAAGDDPSAFMSPQAEELFERRVRPIFIEHCGECHGAQAKGELRLDSLAGMATGGASGPAVTAGDADGSLIVSALRYESYEMPPGGPLPAAQVEAVAEWVNLLDEKFAAAAKMNASSAEGDPAKIAPQDPADHWAYEPPHRSEPPQLEMPESAPLAPIDRFVRARLQEVGIPPAAPASPRELLRRVHYDLTGLPPTAEQVAAFVVDPSNAAYERVVDELLAAPQFGERWARHWLDLARYSDTRGYVFEEDRSYPNAWKYRDWVVQALNTDMPYDRFVVAQLAGDQLDDPAAAPASGFLTLGRRFLNNPHDIIDDRINVITRGLLGLTVACARCHDHKYDAISSADYYALYGVLNSCDEQKRDDLPPRLVDKPTPVEPVVFLRGNPGAHGESVPRRFLTCLSAGEPTPFQHGSGRMELAERIASPDNPLTARVWANRVWMHLLGRGLVTTPSDFGVRGEPPTHPQLLDWLACTLVDDGWSTKSLVRRIVLSETYRQSSRVTEAQVNAGVHDIDPDNALLWHATRKRLDLEQLRDSLLAAAGVLDLTVGGPPASLTDAPPTNRRALYGYIERQNLPQFFRTFDFANPNTHTAVRAETLSPHQALFMLNSPLVSRAACQLAARAESEAAASEAVDAAVVDDARVVALFCRALGREPTDAERRQSAAFVQALHEPGEDALPDRNPWDYGWGRFDAASQRVEFHDLPQFVDGAWQGGPALPDVTLGWVTLRADGGHPGDADHSAIVRCVVPTTGTARVTGRLAHPAEQGDGVRLRLICSRRGLLAEWAVYHGEAAIDVDAGQVNRGDELYCVVDCRDGDAYDSFELTVAVTIGDGAGGQAVLRSNDQFHGPLPPPLDRWQQLAQVLLMSNEFLFVD